MTDPTVKVEILTDGAVDGTEYSKGETAKLTPFQAKCAERAGLAKLPKVEKEPTHAPATKTAPRKGARTAKAKK